MGKHDRCCVGGCNNDKRYPNKYVKRSHVQELKFHRFTSVEDKRKIWIKNISKGLVNFNPGKETFICSNHFVDGQPTNENPHPTLFLTPSGYLLDKSPHKRASSEKSCRLEVTSKRSKESPTCEYTGNPGPSHVLGEPVSPTHQPPPELNVSPGLKFEQLTRESEVKLYTGFKNPVTFKLIFEYLQPKALNMTYWKGESQLQQESSSLQSDNHLKKILSFYEETNEEIPNFKRGPKRKLDLEQELLLVFMRLRLGLLVEDLAFRFKVAPSTVTMTFTTWIRLMAKELDWLIVWPDKGVIKRELPESFRRLYPKVRCIIDCTEVFTETPSALDIQAILWSEYKHHTTIKFLVSITPNGSISYVSPCYGGRASDKFIVRDCGFLNLIEPFDQIMADRGFKIKEDLLQYQAYLCIPPSTVMGMQQSANNVKETSRIANVRIYVEQAIGRLKKFRMLGAQLPVRCLPLCDDIVTVCCALVNLKRPLCV